MLSSNHSSMPPYLNDHLYVREFGDSSMPPSSAIKRRQSPDWCHSLTELGARQTFTNRVSDQEQGLSDICSDARLSARMRAGNPESLRVAGAGAAQGPGHLRQEHAGWHDVQCGRCWWVVTWWHDVMMSWCHDVMMTWWHDDMMYNVADELWQWCTMCWSLVRKSNDGQSCVSFRSRLSIFLYSYCLNTSNRLKALFVTWLTQQIFPCLWLFMFFSFTTFLDTMYLLLTISNLKVQMQGW